jgi:large subunit ribosomal protein L30
MTSKAARKGAGTIVVRQVKSGIGFPFVQKRTLRALGLGRIGRERTLPDNPAVRGQVFAVQHLVVIVGEGGAASTETRS